MFKRSQAEAANAQLTQDGKSAWKTYLSEEAGKVERFAASELLKYVHQMSGIQLAETKQPDSDLTILLGLRKHLDQHSLPDPKPGFDGYILSIDERQIIIAGDNARGVLYGAYDLLERLGCRWYHPALDPNDPEVVPENADLTLNAGQFSESARIEDRIYWISSLAFRIVPENVIPQLDWAAKNRYNGLSWQGEADSLVSDLELMESSGIIEEMEKRGLAFHGPGHSFHYFISTQEYFEAHPEWFGYADGKRHPHGGQWPLVNFCLCKQEASRQFVSNVEKFVKRFPYFKFLNILPIDGGVPCRCEECEKVPDSDLLIALYNQLSEHLAEVAPGVTVDACPGYGPLTSVPETTFPNRKWQGLYAHWGRNNNMSYDDPHYVRRPSMLTWASYFDRFWICSYYAANSHQPFTGLPFLRALELDTKFMVERGVTGTLVLEYPFGFWWNNSFNIRLGAIYPYYYPERDPLSEIRDYALNYYGPDAGPILAEFFEMIGDNRNLERTYLASRGDAGDEDMAWLMEWRKMISRAEQLASSDPVYSYRVSKLAGVQDMLIHLGPSRRKIVDIEQSVDKVLAGEMDRKVFDQKCADARAMISELVEHSERLAEKESGLMSAEWFKSWLINRTFVGPMENAQKKLEGEEIKQEEKLPDYVVDTDL